MSGETIAMTEADRAQTVLDYAVGIGLFLVVIVFVVAFTPELFAAFGDTDHAPAADRYADDLTNDILGNPADSAVLDPACTVAFFEQFDDGADPGDDCRFGVADTPRELLGATQRVHVSIEHRAPGEGVLELDGQELALAERPGSSDSVTVARRTVLLDGTSYRLIVRVW